jgi:hypothetical protein
MTITRQIVSTMIDSSTQPRGMGPAIRLEELRRRASQIDTAPITIRPAHEGDQPTLAALAALDSAEIPSAPVLIAELDGEPRAALSLSDDSVIADPFFLTDHLVELMRSHAARTAPAPRRRRSYRPRFA